MKGAVAHARSDAVERRLCVESAIHVRAPSHQRAGQHPASNARTNAAHNLASALPLMKRGAPLDVTRNLQTTRGLRRGVAAETSEQPRPRGFRGPRAEHARASFQTRHQHNIRARRVLFADRVRPLGKTKPQVFPGPSRERAFDANRLLRPPALDPVRVLLPVLEPPARGLAVPEAKRVKGHRGGPGAPPRYGPPKRVALPERNGNHPVLNRGFARRAQRGERRRAS